MSMNFKDTKASVIACIAANLVPFVQSSPGIGKSAMAKEIAEHFNLCLIDYRISSADITDFNGFPKIDPVTNTATYVPFDTFPVDTTPLPDKFDAQGNVIGKYDGWLILMDELNHGNPTILRSCYKLILDKMVGQRKLHSRARIMACGNLATDNAMTNKLGSALDSRVIQYFLRSDHKEWIPFANTANFDFRITSWIGFSPDKLNVFTPDTPPGPYACQRTWEFVHKLIHKIPVLDSTHVELISGAIGEGAAREFIGYTKVFQDLPTIDAIVNSPVTAKLPTSPDCMFAVCGLLGNYADLTNITSVMKYAARLPLEFNVVALQSATMRNKTLLTSDAVTDWIEENLDHLT